MMFLQKDNQVGLLIFPLRDDALYDERKADFKEWTQ